MLCAFLILFPSLLAGTGALAQDATLLAATYETSSETVDGTGSSSSKGQTSLLETRLAANGKATDYEYTVPGDPEDIRGEAMSAQSALVVAQISGEDLPPEQASADAASICATGTIEVELHVDADGTVWLRTETSDTLVEGLDFDSERRRSRYTVERRRYAP